LNKNSRTYTVAVTKTNFEKGLKALELLKMKYVRARLFAHILVHKQTLGCWMKK
jgi:hypothetical protein